MSEAPQEARTTDLAKPGIVDQGLRSTRNICRLILLVLLVLEAALLIFGPQLSEHLPKVNTALADGKRPDWWDDACIGIHYAALVNAVLIVLLLVTSKLWTCRPSEISDYKFQITNPRWFWPLTIIAILTCVTLRYPLASKSLWWDEAWVIQQVSHGKWTPDKKHPGELKFQAHDWSRCAWYYQKPTNHAPMSLLQKASITAWQALTGAKRHEFTDLTARVPSLLASCLAVGLVASLLRSWGRPGGGVAAAFLLAAHPWAIRYGVDARGYALVIPLCISGMFAITRIVASRGGKTWPWVWWGATEFLWLWAFPNAVIDIAALNLLTAWLLWRSLDKQDRATVMMRLVVTNVFAAMCFIHMFLPNLMQARRWAGQEADKHVLDEPLLKQTVSNLLAGIDPGEGQTAVEALDIPQMPQGLLLGILMLVVVMIVISIAGKLAKYLKKGSQPRLPRQSWRWIPLTLLGSSVLFMLLSRWLETYFYPRFIIAALPCFVIITAGCLTKTPGWPVWMSFGFRAVAFALALWLFSPMWGLFGSRPIAPLQDVAAYVQSASKDTKPIIACYGLGREVMPVYEPKCLPVENAAGVEALLQRSKAENRPLYLIYGYTNFNRTLLADGFKLLDDKALFEEVKAFPGIESEFYFRVLKAR
jgi:hypothetical protein